MHNFDSPCMSLCELDETGKYCLGCKRTDAEVFSWMTYSVEERKQIMKELKERNIDSE